MLVYTIKPYDMMLRNPQDPTYTLRIASPGRTHLLSTMRESPHYVRTVAYEFDDPAKPGKAPFTADIAKKMLEDIALWHEKVQTILVNSQHASRRGPAVAIAIDELFGFGNARLRNYHKFMSVPIYDEMMNTGARLGIGPVMPK
jgi:hypothetical protein